MVDEKKIDMTNLEQLPGVGAGTATKMREGGILTIMGVATSTPGQMKDAAGTTEAAARKLINAARDLCKLGFELGSVMKQKQDTLGYIPTNCESIDKLLGGGLQLGTTMEAFGQFSSGKTNLSHLFAVSTIKQFPDATVIWVDTENTFSAKRIEQFCRGMELDSAKVLAQIKVGKSVSSDHQILLTESIEKEIIDNKQDVKLIIVDSLMNHFRAEYLGRGTLATRQQMINGYLHKIATLVANYGMAVYMTNQIQSNPAIMFGSPDKAIGGNIVGHFATTRVMMTLAAKGTRRMRLVDSPDLPEGEAIFKINENNLESVE